MEDVYDVIDSSKKAFEHVKRAQKIAREVGIEYENFYVVGGYRFPTHLEAEAKNRVQTRYVGKISYDENVENFIMNGRSLLELPSDSPAYISVKNILVDTTVIN